MDISFASPQLSDLDHVQADAFVLPWFDGEPTLKATLGLIDWRLAGWLTELLEPSTSKLAEGDHWLVGLSGKFLVPRLLLCGLGLRSAFGERAFLSSLQRCLEVARRARLRRLALELPGRAYDLIAPARAMELIFRDDAVALQLDDMVLIDVPDAQHEVQSTVRSLVAGQRRRSLLPAAE